MRITASAAFNLLSANSEAREKDKSGEYLNLNKKTRHPSNRWSAYSKPNSMKNENNTGMTTIIDQPLCVSL